MKGDISADFHSPDKGYSGVRGQMGRVFTDADLNVALEVIDGKIEELVRSLLCSAGSPDDGFRVTVPTNPDGSAATPLDFDLSAGTFVLGGQILRLRKSATFLAQDDWLSLSLDATALDVPPDVLLRRENRSDLVWLEMIEQPVRAVEDREIQERALGVADTTTRVRPQVKIHVLRNTPAECAAAAEELRTHLTSTSGAFSDDGTELHSGARLSVRFIGDSKVSDPCAPRPVAGYLGAENQTLKVMLTDSNHFLWAYDHGEPLYRVELDSTRKVVQFSTEPRDPVLFPRAGQVLEILPWDVLLPNREKAAAPLGHTALLSNDYNPTTRQVEIDTAVPSQWVEWLAARPENQLSTGPGQRYFYARVWQEPEGSGVADEIGSGLALRDTGLELNFLGPGIAGDYWTIALRPETPQLVVPWALLENQGAPPAGPRRFAAPLALLHSSRDAAGRLRREVHDCRNRFLQLCQIKSCCTYRIGDGKSSFGDFDSIQEALNALPAEGGELCLLPGEHAGPVRLFGRRGVTLKGCGSRTVVLVPGGGNSPVFRILDSARIRLENFRIDSAEGLAVEGGPAVREITLRNLELQGTNGGVLFTSGVDLRIEECTIRSRLLPAPLDETTAPGLLPLVYLRGHRLTVKRSVLVCDRIEDRNQVALGGLQIGGDSTEVRILDNEIAGGTGPGITLGSVVETGRDGPDVRGFTIAAWLAFDRDRCLRWRPGGTLTTTTDPDRPSSPPLRCESQGPLVDVRILGNTIRDSGGSGITVGHWFIAKPDAKSGRLAELELDDLELEEAVIANNRIERCMDFDLRESLTLDAAFASGYGGIALASASDLRIEDNEIRDCGNRARTSICGIYVRYGEEVHITGNRILDNGRRATLRAPLFPGNGGGIVLSHVEGRDPETRNGRRQGPSLFLRGNVVITPEGRALEVSGSGQILVEGNSFTSHGNNSLQLLSLIVTLTNLKGQKTGAPLLVEANSPLRAHFSRLGGAAVLIQNTELYRQSLPLGLVRKPSTFAAPTEYKPSGNQITNVQPRPIYVDGRILFNDNQVTLDVAEDTPNLSPSSILILGLDDISMNGNQCVVNVPGGSILSNAIVWGNLSVRVQGNRFRENGVQTTKGRLLSGPLSAYTMAYLNATELNQGDHCFLRLGSKKPRLVSDLTGGDLPVLDTNRVAVSEALCAGQDRQSHANR